MWLSHSSLNEHEEKLLNMTDKEFDEYMVEKYPDQFRGRPVQPDQKVLTCMNFGFEIGKGWRHIMDSLCQKLQAIYEASGVLCVFTQIKEKFGTGSFYYMTENTRDAENAEVWNSMIDKLVSQAEDYTAHVCEELGTNYYKDERVAYPGWTYGMSVDGFKKWINDSSSSEEEKERRIHLAEEATENRNRRVEISEQVRYDINDETLAEIEKLLSVTKES